MSCDQVYCKEVELQAADKTVFTTSWSTLTRLYCTLHTISSNSAYVIFFVCVIDLWHCDEAMSILLWFISKDTILCANYGKPVMPIYQYWLWSAS